MKRERERQDLLPQCMMASTSPQRFSPFQHIGAFVRGGVCRSGADVPSSSTLVAPRVTPAAPLPPGFGRIHSLPSGSDHCRCPHLTPTPGSTHRRLDLVDVVFSIALAPATLPSSSSSSTSCKPGGGYVTQTSAVTLAQLR